MVSQSRRRRGRQTEIIVSDYFVEQGFTNAHPVGPFERGSDIKGLPIDVEVKARKNLDIKGALSQIKARTNRMGMAVLRLNGQANPADYACIMRLEDVLQLLKRAGWDKVKDTEPIRCNQCGSWNIEGMECLTCQNMTTNARSVNLN